jgi:hypothetical protein
MSLIHTTGVSMTVRKLLDCELRCIALQELVDIRLRYWSVFHAMIDRAIGIQTCDRVLGQISIPCIHEDGMNILQNGQIWNE